MPPTALHPELTNFANGVEAREDSKMAALILMDQTLVTAYDKLGRRPRRTPTCEGWQGLDDLVGVNAWRAPILACPLVIPPMSPKWPPVPLWGSDSLGGAVNAAGTR